MTASDTHERLRRHLESILSAPVKKRRIRAILVNSGQRWQQPLFIEVGGTCAGLERNGSAETILAIFESSVFVVVTPDHDGVARPPYLFAKEDVRQVVEMD